MVWDLQWCREGGIKEFGSHLNADGQGKGLNTTSRAGDVKRWPDEKLAFHPDKMKEPQTERNSQNHWDQELWLK